LYTSVIFTRYPRQATYCPGPVPVVCSAIFQGRFTKFNQLLPLFLRVKHLTTRHMFGLGSVVSQENNAPDAVVPPMENMRIWGSHRRSLMLPVFCKKYFIPVKRCPLWFTKKCPNFLVYYLSQQLFDHFMFTSDHIWLYFHTFQIPFSFSYILLFLIHPVIVHQ
jgi:hypothetical protein